MSEDAIQAFYTQGSEQWPVYGGQPAVVSVQAAGVSLATLTPAPTLEAFDDVSFVDDGEGEPLPAEGSIEADPAFTKPAENDLLAFDDVSISDEEPDEDEPVELKSTTP